MVRMVLRSFSQQEWSGIVSDLKGLSLVQTWEYGEAKARDGAWKVQRMIFEDSGRIIGAVQAMLRTAPLTRLGLVWMNRGPLILDHPSQDFDYSLTSMLEEIRNYWVVRRRMYLRLALPVSEESFKSILKRPEGYQWADAPGWASFRLDLSPSLEQLRKNLQQKWRNCLHKAERSGLTIQCSAEDADFDVFTRRYDQWCQDRRLKASLSADFLRRWRALLPRGERFLVFKAELSGALVGSILVGFYGGTAEYLAAVIVPEGRQINAGHFLLWGAVSELKSRGLRWFDLGGADPDWTPPGIYHFKSGIGGIFYRSSPELEVCGGGWIGRLIRWKVQRERLYLKASV